MGRSIVAIVAGFILIPLLSIGTDMALIAAGVYPPQGTPITDVGLLLLSQAYVAVYAIAGCYLTAFLAPSRPMRHALILGVLGLAVNIAMAFANRGILPGWYVAAAVLLVMPYAWIGGKLREWQLARPRLAV